MPLLPPHLRPRIDLAAVATRYRALRASTGTKEIRYRAMALALDVPRLVSEVDRLAGALALSRLRYANLAAAARASLAAAEDGDADPWEYLRDELTHPTPTETRTERAPARVRSGGVRGRR